jgi:hypothetical protein
VITTIKAQKGMNNNYLYNKVINRYLLSTRSFLLRVQFSSQPVSEQNEELFLKKKVMKVQQY